MANANANEKEVTIKSIDGLANKVVLFLYLNMGIDLIATGALTMTNMMEAGIPESARDGNLPLLGLYLVTFVAGLAQVGLYITCAVFFCKWMYRAYMNALIFMSGKTSTVTNTGTALVTIVFSWAIPIYNLFKPFQNMKFIWQASDARVGEGEVAMATLKGDLPKDFHLWWTFWILQNITGQASFKMALKGNVDPTASTMIDVADTVCTLAAAIFAIRVVKGISERQHHKIHTLEKRQEASQ